MGALHTYPCEDGFYMPGEYEPHHGTFLIWPIRPGSWTNGGREAKPVIARLASEIAAEEEVYLLTDAAHREEAGRMTAPVGMDGFICSRSRRMMPGPVIWGLPM